MPDKTIEEIFDKQGSAHYDEHNSKFAPISEDLHFLIGLILKDLPPEARILCVGVGTGADIMTLAKANPGWRFTGIDPSAAMLEGCQKKLDAHGFSQRCELFRGYLSEFKSDQPYDAVLCLLVMHFVRDLGERSDMFSKMAGHLKPGGFLVSAEISADMDAPDFPDRLEHWLAMHAAAGATPESLTKMGDILKTQLGILPPSQTTALIERAGFKRAVSFFQSFLIHGWVAKKRA